MEGTLRKSKEDHRQIQGELDELKRQKEADIENKSRLQSELENLQRHFSSNLDEKTEHLQEELQVGYINLWPKKYYGNCIDLKNVYRNYWAISRYFFFHFELLCNI